MANHVETVHHEVFGLMIGKLTEDGTKVVRDPKPVSMESDVYSKVTFAIIDAKTGEVKEQKFVQGVLMGCDQLQRNLVVKTINGVASISVDRVLSVEQFPDTKVDPGCAPSKVPAEPTASDGDNVDSGSEEDGGGGDPSESEESVTE